MNETKAVKYDGGKPPMSLLPSAALKEIAKVLDFGATKYSAHNWRKGLKWSKLYNALLRHIFSHMDGEDLDDETKLSHLAHAGCCILFLLEHELKGLGEDDRFKYRKSSTDCIGIGDIVINTHNNVVGKVTEIYPSGVLCMEILEGKIRHEALRSEVALIAKHPENLKDI